MAAVVTRLESAPSWVPAAADHGIDLAALAGILCELGRLPYRRRRVVPWQALGALGTRGPLLASAGGSSLFHCLFGRDACRMALDLLDEFPAVARATLLELARLQGVRDNPRSEEEPGRILHEHRRPGDPLHLQLAQLWDLPYYGAVDSTPLWINLLAAYCARQGTAILRQRLVDRLGRRVMLRQSLLAAVGWIVRRLDDPAGGGNLWVRRTSPHGLVNQVWEDSADSHYHADGALFDSGRPYAPVAVQGYAYDALLEAADLLDGSPGPLPLAPPELRRRAAALRARVLAEFWQPDLGTFAKALTIEPDGSARPARVVASGAGHLLASRLLDGPEAAPFREQLIARLTEADLLAGAGIRTKSTTAPRFRPGSYHNGSSWPMDSGVIADGLRRHGRHEQADDLEARILRACAAVGGFPEFFRGEPDGSIRLNTETLDLLVDGLPNRLEQPPQANQGWTATRVWRILRRRGAIALAA